MSGDDSVDSSKGSSDSGDDSSVSSDDSVDSSEGSSDSGENLFSHDDPVIRALASEFMEKLKKHFKGKIIIKNFSNFTHMHPKTLAKMFKMSACDSGKT